MNRTAKFTNPEVFTFISQLLKDKDFNINKPTTVTYLYEVGCELYEQGWNRSDVTRTLNAMVDMGLIQVVPS